MDYSLAALKLLCGILVSNDGEGRLLLDDGTGVIELCLSADFRLRHWDLGIYVMVIGGYFVRPGETPMVKVHKMVDLSAYPDREAMWYLEVMEAYKLFYQPLIEEFL
ncbi:RecQ-mediated genome instability protein [Salix suchowensis]|nr:RecQ-mediated genome instability protein [Salix suchowensis]